MHFFIPSNSFWNTNAGYFMLIGLGIFIFISGLLIDLNYSEKIKNFSNILAFYKKRAIRILPLNWIAILLFISFTFLIVPDIVSELRCLLSQSRNKHFVDFQSICRITTIYTKFWFISLVCRSNSNMLFYLSDLDKIFEKCHPSNNPVFLAIVCVCAPQMVVWHDG